MKKHTSKSASGTSKTSSQSGTSGRTGATAKRRRPKVEPAGKFDFIVEALEKMTDEEFRQSLINAGILDPATGQLAEKYKKGSKKK